MTISYKINGRKKKDEPLTLMVYGDIGDSPFGESITAAEVVKELEAAGARDIDIKINTHGGLTSDGIAISNAIRNHQGRTRTFIDGVAFSMGSHIAVSADEVHAAEDAILMVHAPHLFPADSINAEGARKIASVLDTVGEALVSGYTRGGKIERSVIEDMIFSYEDQFMTAVEAQNIGLVDHITEPLGIAAKYIDSHSLSASNVAIVAKHSGDTMKDDNTEVTTPEPQASGDGDYMASHTRAVAAGRDQGAAAENKRQKEIRALFCNSAGQFAFGDESDPTNPMVAVMDHCLGDTKCSKDAALYQMNRAMAEGYAPVLTPQADSSVMRPIHTGVHGYRGGYGTGARIQADVGDKFVKGAVDALKIRAGLKVDDAVRAEIHSNEFYGMSLSDLARHSLQLNGMKSTGTTQDVFRRVMGAGPGQGTDHYTSILENIANKVVMERYMAAGETWSLWTQQGVLTDYREASRVNKSLFDKLDKMEEHQAYDHGRFADVKQAIQGFLYGKEFSLTLQAMVNDDLSILTDDMGAWGEAASATVGDLVFTILTETQTGGFGQLMTEDSTALYHANHSNYVASGSGGAPAQATINAARKAMTTQTDPNNRTVSEQPRYIYFGPDLHATVMQLLNSQILITGEDATQGERNYVQMLNLVPIEDYRMATLFSGIGWMMFAGRRTVEVSFVQGQNTPRVDRTNNSGIPGVTWTISLPFGAAALDYRTHYFNYGA